jgi:pilus assembly protein CpaF
MKGESIPMTLRDRLESRPDTAVEPSAKVVTANDIDAVKRRMHQVLIETLGPRLPLLDGDEAAMRRHIEIRLRELLADETTPLSSADRQSIVTDVIDNVVGYGPIEVFLHDPEVTEIMVNNPESIYVERRGKLYPTDRKFLDEQHLLRIIDKIVGQVGRRVDESVPMVDARLPDGSRVNAIVHPLAINGPMLTIRKFSKEPYTVDDLIAFGTFDERVARLLEAAVCGRLNILISGGTGSGKTTLLNVMSSFIPENERIVTIEDAAELRLGQAHVLRLESRPPNIERKGEISIRDLVRNSLRMRPDRIVVGEVRGAEALDMLQAMNTGHDGSLSTVHSNSPRDALARLETMVLMAGLQLPVRAIREQVTSALDLLVHVARLRDGSRRVVQVAEVQGMEGDTVVLEEIFAFDYSMGIDEDGRFRGCIKPTGIRPKCAVRLEDLGIYLSGDTFAYEAPARS